MPKLDKRKVVHKRWNNLKINTVAGGSGCYEHILKAEYRLIHYCLSQRSKVFAVRIDLGFSYSICREANILKDNKVFRGFISNYSKKIRREENFFHYFWARELSEKKKGHYHLMLFYDGSKHQQSYALQEEIRELWDAYMKKHKSMISKGIIDKCNRSSRLKKPVPHYMLNRNEGESGEFKACFERISYLAKENQKRGIPFENNNRFGHSQIPREFTEDRTMESYGPPRKKSFF